MQGVKLIDEVINKQVINTSNYDNYLAMCSCDECGSKTTVDFKVPRGSATNNLSRSNSFMLGLLITGWTVKRTKTKIVDGDDFFVIGQNAKHEFLCEFCKIIN